MNWPEQRLSLQQERLAYRRAVEAVLVKFLGKSKAEAKELVMAWWDRMQGTEVFAIGIFMHDEPINTAADLADSDHTPAVRDLGEAYIDLLKGAMPKVRRKRAIPLRTSEQRTAQAA